MSHIPAIIVHGGAWAIPDSMADASVAGVRLAVQRSYEVLQSGGSAVDAVEAAVVSLEDDPVFDAGTGAVLNQAHEVELDAMIMEGSGLDAGGVASVQNIKNPVKLARLVLDKTPHVLLSGKGANAFAKSMGIEETPSEQLVTPQGEEEWQQYMKFKKTVDVLFRERNIHHHDTVGAAAVDCHGNVSCATSTGGITAKKVGRVGDSPLIGSGGYCDNFVGAVSTTGHGESITKVCLAKHIISLMKEGMPTQDATVAALQNMSGRVQGSGGAVVVSKDGDFGIHFTTERMAWAAMREGELSSGLNPGDGGYGLPCKKIPIPTQLSQPPSKGQIPVILVHGGAASGKMTEAFNLKDAYTNGTKMAAKAGYEVLIGGGSAMDAVVAAVTVMEDDSTFNSGCGSKLTLDNTVEMDAMVMDGKELSAGGIATVQNISNPIQLARMVMEKSDHTLIVDRGANLFAQEMGIKEVETSSLVTDRAKIVLETFGKNYRLAAQDGYRTSTAGKLSKLEHDTVGAVALDTHGNLATATSTGGITGKMPGRVGDSSVVGQGGYADNTIGAVSLTGLGEHLARTCQAKTIIEMMAQGKTPQQAAEKALQYMSDRVIEKGGRGGGGGAIVLSNHGDVGVYTNTEGMAWVWIKDNKVHYGLFPEEHFTEEYGKD